jgi:hypothetical protein
MNNTLNIRMIRKNFHKHNNNDIYILRPYFAVIENGRNLIS